MTVPFWPLTNTSRRSASRQSAATSFQGCQPVAGRLVSGAARPLVFARQVCHCLLLETDDGLVLVDTGFGLGDTARPERLSRTFRFYSRPALDPDETAARHVERLGYAVGDVRHIVLTHLDVDHAGGLLDFPNAKVHLSAAELEAARRPLTAQERFRYHAAQWAHGPDWVPHSTAGDTWFGFSAVRDLPGLPPSILLVPLAGHTRGHLGVAIDTGREDGSRRWLVHAGDAYFNHRHMEREPSSPPFLTVFQSLLQADRTTRVHNLKRLNELALNSEADIFCAHDEFELDRAQA
ncbi:MBL fold metallo-hydrolase [Actinomadura sp. LD22]|uniref:MBL fold metallo-hydrolase n=1 Tax=Actinomadura physcomitrii TaxID=2650748 RepID=A0A6I4MRK6_9ACTN|nr:MBL fold metallo-hydrolase [Actinomadura physcomitrii]MWA05429.1 MBL fold metallo-hydrolase [Actinomadura physcomitrii]